MDKRTEELKTKVSEQMKADWATRARQAGCCPSELLIDLISLSLYGVTFGEHEAHLRREALGMQGLPLVLKRADDNKEGGSRHA